MKNIFLLFSTRNAALSTDQVIMKKTLLSFLAFFLCIGAAWYGWKWVSSQPLNKEVAGTEHSPFQKVFTANGKVFGKNFSNTHLAKSFPKSAAVKNVRVNGDVGMSDDFDAESWKLQVVRATGDTLLLTMDDIKKLPKTEVIFDFKCIEGWSQVTHWGGVKFSDFAAAYRLTPEVAMEYVGLSTPDKEYYVGIDMPSAQHPQTLLCYEMNGKPLPMNQGYPLRMIIPVKYGIKSLKRIGTLFFSNNRPPDYWFEKGYDYYSGL